MRRGPRCIGRWTGALFVAALMGWSLHAGAQPSRQGDASSKVSSGDTVTARGEAAVAYAAADGQGAEAAANALAAVQATPLGFSAKVSPSEVGLGRPFTYEIEIRHDPGERYELPSPLALGTAAVRSVNTDRREEGSVATTTFRIEAAIFDQLGEASLPDTILLVRGDGAARELRIPGAPVTILAVGSGDELADIRPPQELRVPSYRALWIALAVGAAAALASFFYRMRTRRSGSEVPAGPGAEELALDALDRLAAEALPVAGKGREHYFRLSEIVRGYLDDDAGVSARDMTSAELLEALQARPVPGLDRVAFAAWVERGDLARFARLAIDPSVAVADLDRGRELIRSVAAALRLEAERAAALAAEAPAAATAAAATASAATHPVTPPAAAAPAAAAPPTPADERDDGKGGAA